VVESVIEVRAEADGFEFRVSDESGDDSAFFHGRNREPRLEAMMERILG
jgi:hypothetical protein